MRHTSHDTDWRRLYSSRRGERTLFRLTYEHLEYVFDCLRRNTTEVRNIRGYLLTALYNASATINHHYQAEVQHDLDG